MNSVLFAIIFFSTGLDSVNVNQHYVCCGSGNCIALIEVGYGDDAQSSCQASACYKFCRECIIDSNTLVRNSLKNMNFETQKYLQPSNLQILEIAKNRADIF